MKRFLPSQELAPYMRAFEVVEAHAEMTRTLLPETGLVIGFRYAGVSALIGESTSVPNSVITGLRGSVRRMRSSAGSGIVVAKFREGGAAAFFDEPLHELFAETRPLAELVSPEAIARVSSRIVDASTHTERIAIFERFLLARLKPRAPDLIVRRALRVLEASAGSVRIAGLSRDLHISQDAFEKRFRRAVGASPKQFASVVRFRRAVEAYGPNASLAQLSIDAGYCDQSHFIRQCRSITGDPPGRFFASAERC